VLSHKYGCINTKLFKHQEAGSKKQQAYHTEHLVHGHNKKQCSKQHCQASLTCLPDMLSASSGRIKLLILRPGAEKASRSWLLLAVVHHITASWPSHSSCRREKNQRTAAL